MHFQSYLQHITHFSGWLAPLIGESYDECIQAFIDSFGHSDCFLFFLNWFSLDCISWLPIISLAWWFNPVYSGWYQQDRLNEICGQGDESASVALYFEAFSAVYGLLCTYAGWIDRTTYHWEEHYTQYDILTEAFAVKCYDHLLH